MELDISLYKKETDYGIFKEASPVIGKNFDESNTDVYLEAFQTLMVELFMMAGSKYVFII